MEQLKILLFIKPGMIDDPDDQERVKVVCYGAARIPEDEEPSQGFIDCAWQKGIQVAEYDYYPELDTVVFEDELFDKGYEIVKEINNMIMAKFN